MTANTNWTQDELAGSTLFSFGAGGATLSTNTASWQETFLKFSQAACTQHQVAQITLETVQAGSGTYALIAPTVRLSGSGTTPTCYAGELQNFNGNLSWAIIRYVGGSGTGLTSVSGATWSAGDTLQLEATAPVGGITTLNLYHNGTLVSTTTDSTSGMTGTGIGAFGAVYGASTSVVCNSFVGNTNT